jgi:hypothetical protein
LPGESIVVEHGSSKPGGGRLSRAAHGSSLDPASRHRRQLQSSVRRLALALALLAALAVVAAGCGGASPEEKWAGSVCKNIGDWKGKIKQSTDDVRAQLQSPGTGTLAAIQADIRKAVGATHQLAANLKALGRPDTESGAQAKRQIDALASQLDATVTTARQTLQSLPRGADVAATVQKLAPLAPALQSLGAKTSSTLDSVKSSGEKLREGFDKADSCEQFR